MDFREKLADLIIEKYDQFQREEILEIIEIPPQEDMGDLALPCFKFARTFRKAPNLIAEEISNNLAANDYFQEIKNMGPYVNFFINKELIARTVFTNLLKQGERYGSSTLGKDKNVIVEFSSPNIAKPFSIAHIRTTVIGHALRNIYKFLGFNTIAINHLGDYGTQFGKLIVAFKSWGDKETVEKDPIPELLKLYVKFHDLAEENPELEDEARKWFKKLEEGHQEAVELWQWFRDVSLQEFNRIYEMMGIDFDSYAGESFYSDKMDAVIDRLEEKGLLQDSEGAKIVDLEEYKMPPALIKKSDGSTLYITRDLAAAIYRKETYNFYKNIYVVGSQQNLHFQQMFQVLELMGFDWAKDCIHIPFGMVSLEDGTMSTRRGRVVFLEDVLNKAIEKTQEIIAEKNPSLPDKEKVAREVGIGAILFQELSHSRIKDYLFSWDTALSFEGETGPYVQYTHARANSVLDRANVRSFADILAINNEEDPVDLNQALEKGIDFSLLLEDEAYQVIKQIYSFPETILKAMERNEPFLVTRNIIELAQAFNKFYHEYPILVDDPELRKARLLLVLSTRTVIKIGLNLLGIEAPEKM
ncbi:MAG TPA: arginine--tRNA ligase [Halanaerobiales bacterium]|nr:arginine--tRNA ligase [Halanaerobiales bacterium]HPZ62509.1 arginine--tRNA ligase [Halanaerobiales bacterium]HQD03728.1 arginine--tRNA ligase [Halanaerobiales bacterium]